MDVLQPSLNCGYWQTIRYHCQSVVCTTANVNNLARKSPLVEAISGVSDSPQYFIFSQFHWHSHQINVLRDSGTCTRCVSLRLVCGLVVHHIKALNMLILVTLPMSSKQFIISRQ